MSRSSAPTRSGTSATTRKWDEDESGFLSEDEYNAGVFGGYDEDEGEMWNEQEFGAYEEDDWF